VARASAPRGVRVRASACTRTPASSARRALGQRVRRATAFRANAWVSRRARDRLVVRTQTARTPRSALCACKAAGPRVRRRNACRASVSRSMPVHSRSSVERRTRSGRRAAARRWPSWLTTPVRPSKDRPAASDQLRSVHHARTALACSRLGAARIGEASYARAGTRLRILPWGECDAVAAGAVVRLQPAVCGRRTGACRCRCLARAADIAEGRARRGWCTRQTGSTRAGVADVAAAMFARTPDAGAAAVGCSGRAAAIRSVHRHGLTRTAHVTKGRAAGCRRTRKTGSTPAGVLDVATAVATALRNAGAARRVGFARVCRVSRRRWCQGACARRCPCVSAVRAACAACAACRACAGRQRLPHDRSAMPMGTA
jgi:hypothetical protein